MIESKATTQYPISEQLAKRWSGRAYDPNKNLDRKQIVTLLEAARWAPSCFGDEPWRFIICDKTSNETAWQKALDCLAEGNRSWAINAPLLNIIIANTLFGHNDKPNKWCNYDTGAAALSLCVQATDMGLMTHQMGGFDPDKASELFSIPEQFIPIAMMTVGYQLAIDDMTDEIKERELAQRKRKPLGECFFEGEWGKGVV
ncbi:MAG: nitroreductase [Gammaproteobacteria bacterium]|jgi:nitroreductase